MAQIKLSIPCWIFWYNIFGPVIYGAIPHLSKTVKRREKRSNTSIVLFINDTKNLHFDLCINPRIKLSNSITMKIPCSDNGDRQSPLRSFPGAAAAPQVRNTRTGWFCGWDLHSCTLQILLNSNLHSCLLRAAWHELIKWTEGVPNNIGLIF